MVNDFVSQERAPSSLHRFFFLPNIFWHGLQTPNEGINQRNLKFWADVADKIGFGRIYKFGIGI